MGRPFNKEAYNSCDAPTKRKLVEIIEKNTSYRLDCDLDVEMFKKGDVIFKCGDKQILCENELRMAFDKIVKFYPTIHIPIRKRNTPADCYFVWNTDLTQCIFIDTKFIKEYCDNVVDVTCHHEMSKNTNYTDRFIDIPKDKTQWLIIDENLKWTKKKYPK